MIDLSGLPGGLRWYNATQEGEWIHFEHQRSGDCYHLRAADVYELVTRTGYDVLEAIVECLPRLCDLCGLMLDLGELGLCETCIEVEVERVSLDIERDGI